MRSVVSELCGLDLMSPRLGYAQLAVRRTHVLRHPVRPRACLSDSCRHVVRVQQAALAAMRESCEEPSVGTGRHRPIVGWSPDALCHSRSVDFTVEESQAGGIAVVTAAGELDAHSAPSLGAVLGPLSQRRGVELVVDLSAVGFIDSTGLGVLVSTLKHVREAEGRLDVVVATPRVLKVFSLTGLDVVIPLHATIASALAR